MRVMKLRDGLALGLLYISSMIPQSWQFQNEHRDDLEEILDRSSQPISAGPGGDPEYNQCYDVNALAAFKQFSVPADFANKFEGQDPRKIVAASRLGLENLGVEDVVDTEKPNCLIMLTIEDWNPIDWRTAFYCDEAIVIYKSMMTNCDTRVYFVTRETQVYEAIRKSRDLDLLVLVAHGSVNSLTLESGVGEEGTIDTTDYEMQDCLNGLPRKCKIDLFACSCGSAGSEFFSLANFIHLLSGGLEVTAARDYLYMSDVNVIPTFNLAINPVQSFPFFDIIISSTYSFQFISKNTKDRDRNGNKYNPGDNYTYITSIDLSPVVRENFNSLKTQYEETKRLEELRAQMLENKPDNVPFVYLPPLSGFGSDPDLVGPNR